VSKGNPMGNDIKPCPFCGKDPTYVQLTDEDNEIRCSEHGGWSRLNLKENDWNNAFAWKELDKASERIKEFEGNLSVAIKALKKIAQEEMGKDDPPDWDIAKEALATLRTMAERMGKQT